MIWALANNLAFALFYSGDAGGAIKAAQALNPQPKALLAASEAVLHGSKAGLAEANRRSSGDAAFKETGAHRRRDADGHPPVSAGCGFP